MVLDPGNWAKESSVPGLVLAPIELMVADLLNFHPSTGEPLTGKWDLPHIPSTETPLLATSSVWTSSLRFYEGVGSPLPT